MHSHAGHGRVRASHRIAFCFDAKGKIQLNPFVRERPHRAFTNALPSKLLKSNRCFQASEVSDQPAPTRRLITGLCCLPTPAHHPVGGAGRDRTDGLLLAKQALSQLSYGPFSGQPTGHGGVCRGRAASAVAAACCLTSVTWLVGLDGFEPSTPALSRRCSNQLSYRPVV